MDITASPENMKSLHLLGIKHHLPLPPVTATSSTLYSNHIE